MKLGTRKKSRISYCFREFFERRVKKIVFHFLNEKYKGMNLIYNMNRFKKNAQKLPLLLVTSFFSNYRKKL